MQITTETTVKSILDQYPETVKIFADHGVDVPLECDESLLDTELALCDSMCHIDNLDALIADLQNFIDKNK
jgi:hypothetical protein